MKNNMRHSMPSGLTPIFAVVIVACAFAIYKINLPCAVVLFVSGIVILIEKLYGRIVRMHKIKDYLVDNDEDTQADNNEAIFRTLNPIAGILIDGSIAWYNSAFKELFPLSRDKKITELLPCVKLKQILSAEEQSEIITTIGDDTYKIKVSLRKSHSSEHASILLHFEKITEIENLKRELGEEQSVVAEIAVDNYDEALEDASDDERLDIVTLLEKNIVGWAQDGGGIVKKLEKDKYMCVFTHKQLDGFIENKFDILENVRTFNPNMKIPPTVSIGIGVGEINLHENDLSAKKALEMALGRGGDQVVIRENGKFRYFGGNSKETEKRTKVKARIMANNLHELILNADNVLIMGHKNSDTDSVGAAIGIASMAAFENKNVKIILASKDDSVSLLLKKIEENHYHDGLFIGKSGVRELISQKTLLVVLDTHIPEFTEMPELLELVKTKVVIDHHRRSESFIQNADIVYHEPFASSTSEMVAEMMQYFDPGYSVSTVDAEALYAGIVIDTKNFLFKTGVRTFEAAAYLRAAGVDTIRVKKLFRESIENYKLKAEIVTEAQLYNGDIAISLFTATVPHLIVAAAADEMLEISQIKAAFVVARGENGNITVSGRSLGEINVQVVLEKLGGGGHMMQAGTQIEGASVSEVGEMLKTAIDETVTQN